MIYGMETLLEDDAYKLPTDTLVREGKFAKNWTREISNERNDKCALDPEKCYRYTLFLHTLKRIKL